MIMEEHLDEDSLREPFVGILELDLFDSLPVPDYWDFLFPSCSQSLEIGFFHSLPCHFTHIAPFLKKLLRIKTIQLKAIIEIVKEHTANDPSWPTVLPLIRMDHGY